jgi:hypothetical protein
MPNAVVDPEMCFDVMSVEVEGRITRIPRKLFAGSAIFKDMFDLPQAADVVVDGTDNEHPLKLEGLNYNDYKVFVRVAVVTECVAHIHDVPSTDLTDRSQSL